MAELPFLIVHGALVAWVLVAVCAGLTVAVVLLVRTRRETKRTKNLVDAALTGISGLAPGGRLVRGTLRGTAASVADADKILGDSTRSDTLAIEIDGERIVLDGTIRVVRGTHATTVAAGDRRRFEVRDGDDVIAQGTVARAASDEQTGYREGAVAWTMTPPDAQMPIEITAVRACVKPVPLGPIGVVLVALAGAAVGYSVLWKVGAIMLDRAKHTEGARRSLHGFEAIAIAAAMPQTRGDALAVLEDQLRWGNMRRGPRLRIALADMRGDCEDQARARLDNSQYAEALLTAQACGRADLQYTALRRLGRYKEAVEVQKKLEPFEASDPRPAILTGDWTLAMNLALERRRWMRRPDAVRDDQAERRDRDAVCLQQWFRLRGGDEEGAFQLKFAEQTGTSEICKIAVALIPNETGAQRTALEPLVAYSMYDLADTGPVRAAIAWAHGVPSHISLADTLEELPGGHAPPMHALLSTAAASARTSNAEDRAVVDAERAVLEEIRGDAPAALAIATTMTPDEQHGPDRAHLDGFVAALSLFTPRAPIALPAGTVLDAYESAVLLRNGTRVIDSDPELIADPCAPDAHAAALAALAGDGGPLAALADRCNGLAQWPDTLLLAVLPRITKHRTEVAAALRDYLAADPILGDDALRLVQRYALHRDLARAIADEPEADRWQKLLDAQLAALADRDRVIGILLWGAI